MARQEQTRGLDFRRVPQLRPFVLLNARPTGRRIGGGAYGTVEELDVDGLICAGKKLHEVLVERANPGALNIIGKFVEECSLLANLRHPNIVHFLGICFLDTSDVPVLVMEYLPYCLDSLLEDRADMSLAMKCSVLCDVVQALVYLHARAPPVIHRDLSAKSVLLTSSMMAKVADLEVARILSVQSGRLSLSMTQTSATLPYMPPEALAENPAYNTSIDMFSLGHLALYTIVQDFPYPSPAVVMDTNNPGVLVACSEVQRRSQQMEQLAQQLGGETHSLVQLVTQCLHNDPRQRLSAREVLTQLQEVSTQLDDPYQDMSKLELIQTLRRREGERGWNELEAQVTDLETRETEVRARLIQVQGELRNREHEIGQLQEELRIREQELQEVCVAQVRREDAETTESTRTTESSLASSRIPVKQNISCDSSTEIGCHSNTLKQAHVPSWSFNWRRGRNMLAGCSRRSVVILDRRVYINGGGGPFGTGIQEYCIDSDSWRNLPACSVVRNTHKGQERYYMANYTLATFNQELIGLGLLPWNNRSLFSVGGSLTVVVWNDTSREWTTPYPDVLTVRQTPSVIGHQEFLVVAGGSTCTTDRLPVRQVEVFNRSTMQWVSAPVLPTGCSCPTTVVVGDTLYLYNDDRSSNSVSVFCISLPALVSLASSTPLAPPPAWEVVEMDSLPYSVMAHIYPLGSPDSWQVPKELHFSYSTFVCLHNRLLVVGGMDEDNKPSSAICLYNPRAQQKTKIGDLPAVLYNCICAVLPSRDLLILGGQSEGGSSSDVFIATIE